jgi:hypothetical protein
MASLTVNGRKVTVDDSFLSLSPEDQEATVDEIAGSFGDAAPQPDANWRDSKPPEGMTLDPISGQMRDPEMRARANPQNMAQGMMRSGQQGLGFGLGDEFNAGVAATEDWATGRAGFGEAYDSRLEDERAMLDQFRTDHPVAAYGSEIAGALAVPGGTMKAGAKVGENALRLGGVSALQGALYGGGAGEGGLASRARSAAVGGALGGATGAAVPYVLKGAQAALGRGATRKAIDAAADAAPEPASLARQSGALYEKARQSGVVVKSDAMRPLLDDISSVGSLDDDFTPDALKVIGRLTSKLEAGDLPLGELEALHRRAGLAITKNRIANPADAGAAGKIAQKVDEFMMNIPDDAVIAKAGEKDEAVETFRQARTLWKQYRNSERLQEIVAKAEIAENPAGAIRSGFRSILNNKNKRATYSKAELQVMRQVISDTKAGGWVQRLIGYGTGLTRQVVATSAGYGVGGPIGAALGSAAATKIGSVAKDAANDAALAAGDRAARFSATGGQYAQPAPQLLPNFENALRVGQKTAAPVGVNLWNR